MGRKILVLLAAIAAGLASITTPVQAATCEGQITKSIVAAAGADADSKALLDSIENTDLPPELRRCEAQTLTRLAITSVQNGDACNGNSAQVAKARYLLLALGSMKQPWMLRGPDENARATKLLREQLSCMDSQTDRLIRQDAFRQLRQATELALANAKFGFSETLRMPILDCAGALDKIGRAERQQQLVKSEFAIKAAIVTAASMMQATAQPGCTDHETALRSALDTVENALESKMAGKSLEGWRWVNDLLYMRAAYLLALGELETARVAIDQLSKSGSVTAPDGPYNNAVHPVALTLLKQEDQKRADENSDLYRDQIFVLEPIPGYVSSFERFSKRYFSLDDAVNGLRAALEEVQEFPPENYPCSGSCQDTLDSIDGLLNSTLVRSDLKVVAGSFRNEDSAERGLRSVCSNLPGKYDCPFSIELFRSYNRIATKQMSEDEARELSALLEKNKLDSFLSRPRVLPPL